jgi:hypothetical protein
MKKNTLHVLVLLMLALTCLQRPALAQGPYSYNSPDGAQMLFESGRLSSSTGYKLSPSVWQRITDPALTGIEITCTFTVNLASQMPLFTFYADSTKYLEIFYHQNTLLFRRYKNPDSYYDYQLLDPLVVNSGSSWNLKLYFTGSFFWIQTSNSSTGNYLSPVYFGVNSLTDIPMQQLLTGNRNSFINIGTSGYQDIAFSGYVRVYAFNPTQLTDNIQANFSNNTPYAKKKTGAADDEIYDPQN